ncbi:MAG: DNA mismatch repair protein MutS [Planctomycetes bacterium]|nr:DNA mismatch repair protein MutS [Planctomycetota bacterium]
MSDAPAPLSPAMRQYQQFKTQHPGCVLFFRMGDFYEMFFEDAVLANRVLGVTLTQRTEGVPMAGVPFHSVEGYLRRMIQAGHRVAVCEQMEEAALAKGVVRREVTRVITPGTLTDDSLLEEGKQYPLAAVLFHDAGDNPDATASLAWVELSTGDFRTATLPVADLTDEMARVAPSELLYVETADGKPPARVRLLTESFTCAATGRPGWQFHRDEAVETLKRQFGVASLAGFGIEDSDPALGPASALVHYLLETQRVGQQPGSSPATPGSHPRIAHLQPPRRFTRTDHMVIDTTSLRSLEVERTTRAGGTEGSLLAVMQGCVTAMGKRTLRQWLCFPLARREPIEERQRVVGAMVDDERFLGELSASLEGVQDVQRILGRIAVGRATPRDLVGLGKSASHAAKLAAVLAERPSVKPYHARVHDIAAPLGELSNLITASCVESPPGHLREGGLIRDGYDAPLDECRLLMQDGSTWLASYQKTLIETSGIPSLKVGFNKVFGFYIELTATHRDKAPAAWHRKQTLKNAERFITPELKEYEGKVLSAEQRAVAREGELFFQLCNKAQEKMAALQRFAEVVAELDVLACFARKARRRRYVRPTLVDEPTLIIRAGRHPVLDEVLGDQFVPNDVDLGCGKKVQSPESRVQSQDQEKTPETPGSESPTLDSGLRTLDSSSLALITGPNMAGKSTYIRQAALITLLAHTGSFVPAEEAIVGLCDRIFTRIGASDELHTGRSTFMVEMTETANICHHATAGSLVILDEIGRGTSTLDGLSLAWAIAEHLAGRGCRTLFATHYHELTALADRFPNVTNLNVTVREWQDQIVFLHRIAPGSTNRSYGIHVAKIAGLPPGVVERANELLGQLSVSHAAPDTAAISHPAQPPPKPAGRDGQMSLFTEYLDHPVVDDLRKIDITRLSPLEAFERLRKLSERARE